MAGAAGTALLVAIMAGRSLALGQAGASEPAALTGGIQSAFGVAALISIAVIGCAAFLRNDLPAEPHGDGGAAVADPSPEYRVEPVRAD